MRDIDSSSPRHGSRLQENGARNSPSSRSPVKRQELDRDYGGSAQEGDGFRRVEQCVSATTS